MDPEGQDLAVHGGVDLGAPLRFLGQALELAPGLGDRLLSSESGRLLAGDRAGCREAGDHQSLGLSDLRLLERERRVLLLKHRLGVLALALEFGILPGEPGKELALLVAFYREVTAMIAANPRLQVPSIFYDWLHRVYRRDMTLGIRRLVDWDPRTLSLIRLMEEIEAHPEVLSRRRFVHRYRRDLKEIGHRDFDHWARPGASQIDPRVIRRDRRELVRAQRRLRAFVNRYVAHRSRRPMRRLPTYAELDACLDLLERLIQRYTLLLEQASMTRVDPVIQHDWKRPSRVAWI